MILFHLFCCLISDSIFCFRILVAATGFIVCIFKSHLPSSDITQLHILNKKLTMACFYFSLSDLYAIVVIHFIYTYYKPCTKLLLFFVGDLNNNKVLIYLPLQSPLHVPLFRFIFSSSTIFLLTKGLPLFLVEWVCWWLFVSVLICMKTSITIFQGYFLWVHHVFF